MCLYSEVVPTAGEMAAGGGRFCALRLLRTAIIDNFLCRRRESLRYVYDVWRALDHRGANDAACPHENFYMPPDLSEIRNLFVQVGL